MRTLKIIIITSIFIGGIAGILEVDKSYASLTGNEPMLIPRYIVTDEVLTINVCGKIIEIERNFIFKSKKRE